MRLYFPDASSPPAINVSRLKKSGYNTRRIVVTTPSGALDTLILLCNGTPDDRVLGVLAHHLDGNKIVAVVKPTEKRLAKAAHIEVRRDSKESWKSLNSLEQRRIFSNLRIDMKAVEQLFPQQVIGCKRLEDIC